MFVEVVVLRSVAALDERGPLTWAVPEALRDRVVAGVRVVVPLAGKDVTGVVTGFVDGVKEGVTPKLLREVLDSAPVVDAKGLALARFVARYYEANFVDALRLVLPPDTEEAPRRRFKLSERGERARVFFSSEGLNAADVALLQVFEEGLVVDETKLKRSGGTRLRLQKLIEKGLVDELQAARPVTKVQTIESLQPREGGQEIPRAASALRAFDAWLRAFVDVEQRNPTMREADTALGGARQKASKLQALGRLVVESQTRDPLRRVRLTGKGAASQLTDAQDAAVNAVVDAAPGSAFLLEGVTGSGKTEVYLRVLQRTLTAGKSALLLVPEIGLKAKGK